MCDVYVCICCVFVSAHTRLLGVVVYASCIWLCVFVSAVYGMCLCLPCVVVFMSAVCGMCVCACCAVDICIGCVWYVFVLAVSCV